MQIKFKLSPEVFKQHTSNSNFSKAKFAGNYFHKREQVLSNNLLKEQEGVTAGTLQNLIQSLLHENKHSKESLNDLQLILQQN